MMMVVVVARALWALRMTKNMKKGNCRETKSRTMKLKSCLYIAKRSLSLSLREGINSYKLTEWNWTQEELVAMDVKMLCKTKN